jgi:hypothetical protein
MVGMEVQHALSSTSFYEGGLQCFMVKPEFSFIQKHSKQTDFTLPFSIHHVDAKDIKW